MSSAEFGTCERLRFGVAGLAIDLDARGSGLRMALPGSHRQFFVPCSQGGLALRVRSGGTPNMADWNPLFQSQAWGLWQDGAQRRLFMAGWRDLPKRHILVDADHASGEVMAHWPGQGCDGAGIYPLQDIDIVLFSNWLADHGDVLLHASGVAHDGAGYCFAGHSGAGKSTVAAAVSGAAAECTLLGEDNLALRYLGGRFWIFGTPWHTHPSRCSPRGVPLKRLHFLDRTSKCGMWPCRPADGIARLLGTAFLPYYRPDAVAHILDNLALLAEQVTFLTLGYELGSDPMALIRP